MTHKVKLIYFKKSGKYYSEGYYQSEAKSYEEIVKEVTHFMSTIKLPGLCAGAFYDTVMLPEKEEFAIPALFKADDFR